MARVFISHSSRNNDKAIEVRDWLAANGWEDVFLDLDPERGIVAGQRWKEALQKAASRCEVVLALVSTEWLASSYCKAEINTAQMMGKKTIIALIDKSQVPGDLTDEQFIDLSGDPQAYRRLKKGLELAGLDPLSFPFEPGRRPYPGFAHFEEQDVAVFFGRDAQIVRGLDELRRLVRTGVSRMLVILGASGSGKSSFLRAGLWPRLKRDDRAWLPLPIIRPEHAVISGTYGLAGALHQIISEARFAPGFRQRGLPRSHADIEDFIEAEDGLAKLFDALRDIGQVPGLSGEAPSPPTIVLALDQGEELFNEEGRDEAERFVEILTRTLRADPHTLAILAMRSDSFPLVQAHPSLAALPKDTFTLDMMLEGSYRAVIEDPARLIQPTPLRIDPQLTEALLKEISGQDALPLLAFTLAHLYEKYRTDNELTLAGYDKLGHVSGVIDTAVKQAFAAGVAKGRLPNDAKAQLTLARAAFIPHLAQVNPAGRFVRRVATLDQIPADARPLIDSFAEQRLLTKDRRKDADGRDADVVEVAHEALLRQPPFSEWLDENRDFLIWRERLSQARTAFEADERGLLAGRELEIARSWAQTQGQHEIESVDQKFINDSSAADDQRRTAEAEDQRRRVAAEKEEQERRIRDAERIAEEQKKAAVAQKRTARVTLAGLAVAVLVAAVAIWQYFDAKAATRVAQIGQIQALSGTSKALLASNQKFDDLNALIMSLQAGKRLAQISSAGPLLRDQVWAILQTVVYGVIERDRLEKGKGRLISGLDADGLELADLDQYGFICSWDNLVCLWDKSGEQIAKFLGSPSDHLESATFSPDRSKLITVSTTLSDNGSSNPNSPLTLRLWDLKNRTQLVEFKGRRGSVWGVSYSPDGSKIAVAGDDGIQLWDSNGKQIPEFQGRQGRVTDVAFSPDGTKLAAITSTRFFNFKTKKTEGDQSIGLWDLKGQLVTQLKGENLADMNGVTFTPDGNFVVTAGEYGTPEYGTVRFWDLSGNQKGKLRGPFGRVIFSPDGSLLAGSGEDGIPRVWELSSGKQLFELKGHHGSASAVTFSRNNILVTDGEDNTARVWDLHDKEVFRSKGPEIIDFGGFAFSPDGREFATGEEDGEARLWDLSGAGLAEFQGPHREWKGTSVTFSLDGQELAVTGQDGIIRLWDLKNKKLQRTEAKKTQLRDGSFLLSSRDQDGTTRLWNWEGQQLAEFKDLKGDIKSVNLSNHGNRFATFEMAGQQAFVYLWNWKGRQLAKFETSGESVVFSPDGNLVATDNGETGAVKLRDLSGKQLAQFEAATYGVVSISFSPDGKLLATAGLPGIVKVWDLETNLQVAEFDTHRDGQVKDLTFSPDGKLLAIVRNDGIAEFWRVESLDDLIIRGCDWVRNYLQYNSKVEDSDRHVCDGIGPPVNEKTSRAPPSVQPPATEEPAQNSAQTATVARPSSAPVPAALANVSSAPAFPPASEKTSPDPVSASEDPAAIGEREVATPEAPKDPGPHHSQHITHTASPGNIPASTGNTTARLNRQELTRHRSDAETPDNGILGFFGSLFH